MLFREHDYSYSDPKKYPRLSLAQPATHDPYPLALLWNDCWANIDAGNEVEHNRWELRRIMNFGGIYHEAPYRELSDRIHEAFTRAVMHSIRLAVFQVQDVFGGQTARFNVPGSTSTPIGRLGSSRRSRNWMPIPGCWPNPRCFPGWPKRRGVV